MDVIGELNEDNMTHGLPSPLISNNGSQITITAIDIAPK